MKKTAKFFILINQVLLSVRSRLNDKRLRLTEFFETLSSLADREGYVLDHV